MVILNDKLVRLPLNAVVQMLSGMMADQVEKIEIISSPPARYDSEGNAGLINIVSVNNLEKGTNGSFSSHLGHGGHERNGASFNLNHRKEKIRFYLEYSGMKIHNIHFVKNLQIIDLPDHQYQSKMKSERDNTDWNQNLRTGVEYVIKQKTTIGSQFTAFNNKRDQLAINLTEIIERKNLTTLINVFGKERDHWWNYAVNLNLNHRITLANNNSEKGFKTQIEVRPTTRVLRLTYSLNFGNKLIRSVIRDTGSEEERKRVE